VQPGAADALHVFLFELHDLSLPTYLAFSLPIASILASPAGKRKPFGRQPDIHRPVAIGAPRGETQPGIALEDVTFRMPEAVAIADRNHRRAGCHRLQE